jgi:hypothetical protein
VIIIPSALLASPPAGEPLTHARIGYQTWTREDGVTATGSTEAEDAPADAVLSYVTNTFWEPTALPATLTIDFGRLRQIDYVGIGAHTIGSSECSVAVATSPDNSTYTDFSDDTAPGNDAAIMFLDDAVSCRYLRLSFAGSVVMPRVGVVYAGEVLTMYRALYAGHQPITMSRRTTMTTLKSRGGQLLGRSFRRHGIATPASYKNLPSDWVRENLDPFVRSARLYPYFWAWRPQDFPEEVGYVWTDDDIAPKNSGPRDLMEVGWEMEGIGHQ